MPYELVCTLNICINPLWAALRRPRIRTLAYGRYESVARHEGDILAQHFTYLRRGNLGTSRNRK